jgi:hypothetical protein
MSFDQASIDQADPVDVASFDSFPASDAPAWITNGIGSPRTHHSVSHKPFEEERYAAVARHHE